jgi:hypothetical protein
MSTCCRNALVLRVLSFSRFCNPHPLIPPMPFLNLIHFDFIDCLVNCFRTACMYNLQLLPSFLSYCSMAFNCARKSTYRTSSR